MLGVIFTYILVHSNINRTKLFLFSAGLVLDLSLALNYLVMMFYRPTDTYTSPTHMRAALRLAALDHATAAPTPGNMEAEPRERSIGTFIEHPHTSYNRLIRCSCFALHTKVVLYPKN